MSDRSVLGELAHRQGRGSPPTGRVSTPEPITKVREDTVGAMTVPPSRPTPLTEVRDEHAASFGPRPQPDTFARTESVDSGREPPRPVTAVREDLEVFPVARAATPPLPETRVRQDDV